MPITFTERLAHAWNAFKSRDPTGMTSQYLGPSYSTDPARSRPRYNNSRSIVLALYNRIAMDVADTTFHHVRTDENGKFLEVLDTELNKRLTLEANIDQTSRDFIQSLVLSLFDEGVVAIVPVDTTIDPNESGSYKINSMRVGKIVEWYPQNVKINLYDDQTGVKQDLIFPKRTVCIIVNPFYSVMNEPNSVLQRLIRTLNQLDSVNEQSGSGKLDLLVHLPYITKSATRQEQANRRREEIEKQLSGSKYGIAYVDATEHITQLNRPVENNLMNQVEYLTSMLYSQLGMSKEVFEGTATGEILTNYFSRTIEPVVAAIALEMKRKFLTSTAIAQHQTIQYFRDPFRFVPVSQIAEIADKFTRNEILTSNEVRQLIGMKAVENDPRADQLLNKNLSYKETEERPDHPIEASENQNGG